MRAVTVALQVLISLAVTASLMPVLIYAQPAARDGRYGLATMAGLFVLIFVVLALAWPKKKARSGKP